jgi:ankyrin repeat protein
MGGLVSRVDHEYEKLKKYLDDGGDPNARTDEKSQLYLHLKYPRCFKLLLERGADPNQRFWQGSVENPLVTCIQWGHDHLAMLLIQHGANVHCKDLSGRTLIRYVDVLRQRKIFEALLERGVDINSKDDTGKTTLDCRLVNRRYFDLTDGTLIFLARRGARIDFKFILPLQKENPELWSRLKTIWSRRKWLVVRCSVKLLGLQQRAVVTANHPLRKLERGEFKEDGE